MDSIEASYNHSSKHVQINKCNLSNDCFTCIQFQQIIAFDADNVEDRIANQHQEDSFFHTVAQINTQNCNTLQSTKQNNILDISAQTNIFLLSQSKKEFIHSNFLYQPTNKLQKINPHFENQQSKYHQQESFKKQIQLTKQDSQQAQNYQQSIKKSLFQNHQDKILASYEQKQRHQQNQSTIQLVKQKSKERKEEVEQLMANSQNILLESDCQKRSDEMFSVWRHRHLILTPDKLYFFTDKSRIVMKGCLNLRCLALQIIQEKDVIVIDLKGEGASILLKPQLELRQRWCSWLKYVIYFHEKCPKLHYRSNAKQFYRMRDTISEEQLINSGETGDLLLFRTNTTAARLQRMLTGSSVDHVAVVVRLGPTRKMTVLEANVLHGVMLYNWEEYIEYFNLYEVVTLRRLWCFRQQEVHQHILQFARRFVGRKYQLTPSQLLCQQSSSEWEALPSERGFFCSELVAKAYKAAGLLDPLRASARYWPKDFATQNYLFLLDGAILQQQQTIVLEKHRKN